jgi:chromosome segregation ATPase
MQKDLKKIFGDHHGLDERSVEFLTGALAKSNLPGFDYLEFKQSLAALSALNMEEETAIKSAYATAATVGLTKDKLLKTAQHYKQVLNSEKQQFDAALQKQIDSKIKGKAAEVAKLKKQVEEYQAKIAQLEAQIAKSQETIDHAYEHINAAKEKIDATRENFEHTLQSVFNQIDKDIENINKYL